ncbi:hypothetical protein [Nocardia sp. NPDC004860]|uniref:hypothetical protein n=1 Tax=Nocardia sp. NPDC004860 TaxID=3154557 RepID=UPI0033B8F808
MPATMFAAWMTMSRAVCRAMVKLARSGLDEQVRVDGRDLPDQGGDGEVAVGQQQHARS